MAETVLLPLPKSPVREMIPDIVILFFLFDNLFICPSFAAPADVSATSDTQLCCKNSKKYSVTAQLAVHSHHIHRTDVTMLVVL